MTQEQKLQEMKKALEAQFKYDRSTAADIALDTLRRCYPEEYVTKPQS